MPAGSGASTNTNETFLLTNNENMVLHRECLPTSQIDFDAPEVSLNRSTARMTGSKRSSWLKRRIPTLFLVLSMSGGVCAQERGFAGRSRVEPTKQLSPLPLSGEIPKWIVGEEVVDKNEEEETDCVEQGERPMSPRRFFSMRNTREFRLKENALSESLPTNRQQVPHPLRTDSYQLDIKWRSPFWRKCFGDDSDGHRAPLPFLLLEFSRDGRVRIVSCCQGEEFNQSATTHIGEWELVSASLCCKIPVSFESAQYTANEQYRVEHLVFTADLHLNPFGERPKLTRGVILRDEPIRLGGMFAVRRVVGTFSGQGHGKDTVDLSYKNRGRT
jgi:hypothetical protein